MVSTDYQSKVNMEIHWSTSYSSWENVAIQTISKVLCLVPSATVQEGCGELGKSSEESHKEDQSGEEKGSESKESGSWKN